MKGIEDFMNLPKGITSRQLLPELIAGIIEIPVDVIASDITGRKIIEFIVGAIMCGGVGAVGPRLSKDWKDRDTEDVYAIAKRWLIDVLDPSADDLVKIANAVQNIRQGVSFGDVSRALSPFAVKSWPQIQADWANVANAFSVAFGMPGAKRTTPTKAGAAAGAGAFSPPGGMGGTTPTPLYKQTLSGSDAATTPTTPPGATPLPGVPAVYRVTVGDHQQPSAPAVTPRFMLTVGAHQ